MNGNMLANMLMNNLKQSNPNAFNMINSMMQSGKSPQQILNEMLMNGTISQAQVNQAQQIAQGYMNGPKQPKRF